MVISDKQTLRRCVKQAVRRTEVVETLLYFDICNGEMGIKTLAETFSQSEGSTPFQANAVAAYAAMEALDMPIDGYAPCRLDSKRVYAGGVSA